MRSARRHNPRGFNLLEVIIAAFIFSAVAISFLGVWGQQVRASEKSRHLMVATFLAEELIEESMLRGYEQMKLTDTEAGLAELPPFTLYHYVRDPKSPTEWIEMAVNYTATREVKQYLDPDDDKLKQVIVRVKWEDTTKQGEVVLETFLAGAQ